MLDERQALSFTYDQKQDIVRVGFEHTRAHAQSKTFPSATRGTLLLDAAGYLVGVDLGNDPSGRAVVMVGPHEAVSKQVESTIVITRVGTADGYEIQIPNAREQVRGNERTPYLK